jgi:hypothetical protein
MTRCLSAPSKSTIVTLFGLLLACAPGRCTAGPRPIRPGDPYLSLKLDDLGFETPKPRFLLGGATMFTVHFADDTHILLTFNTHGLIPRMTDSLPGDDDRLVNALLLELPSGKIVARTQWHTRDREQYLWPLAHGLFLLRIRDRLTILDPVRSLAEGPPFAEKPFLQLDRRIGYISVSPGGDLVVVETVPPPKPVANDFSRFAAATGTNTSTLPRPSLNSPDPSDLTQLRFFRLSLEARAGLPSRLTAQAAGTLTARSLIRVAATADGFLDIAQESPQTWLFDFQSHTGKRVELSPYDTTCAPSPWFISRSEFVALGCRGSETRLEFSGFNLRGEQPWIQILNGQQIAPIILSAPDAGRFAFSRILLSASIYDLENLVPEEITAQEIQVFQHHDGRVLLRVQASPIQRSGQNFDLSPDGLSFTVLRNGNLDIFHLPALTRTDLQQLQQAEASHPERNDARIRLTPARDSSAAKVAPALIPSNQPEAPSRQLSPAEPTEPEAPRKPPTLYDPEHPRPPSMP